MPALVVVVVVVVLAGCHSAAPTVVAEAELRAAVGRLNRPLTGDLAALYRLRVPSSGGLRLALLTAGGSGRMTISEPFGAAVSVTAWDESGRGEVFDFREGCRFAAEDVASVFGVGQLPFPRAVRLLGGRLPTDDNDRVRLVGGQLVVVEGVDWSCEVTVRPDPWRVTAVTPVSAASHGWRIELEDHTSSLPGLVRVQRGDGRWAELRLVKLEWGSDVQLPPLPALEPCEPGR